MRASCATRSSGVSASDSEPKVEESRSVWSLDGNIDPPRPVLDVVGERHARPRSSSAVGRSSQRAGRRHDRLPREFLDVFDECRDIQGAPTRPSSAPMLRLSAVSCSAN